MPPTSTSPRLAPRALKVPQRLGNIPQEQRATTMTQSKSTSMDPAKTDQQLVQAFRSDLQTVRALVTCTICDQLLYEPWTLACGHTYCYSCLCNWFVPNKRKKTCPDCRTIVRQVPAPAFVIKQMTDIFINRPELMPIDETTDHHRERRKCETDAVEHDRGCEAGLFRGCFNQAQGHLQFNEEDHLYRCSVCSHEYLGGATCQNCGVDFGGDEEEIDIDGFSDADIEGSIDGYYDDFHGPLGVDTDEDEADLDDRAEHHEHWGVSNSPPSTPSDQDENTHWGLRHPIPVQEARSRRSDDSGTENSDDEVDDEEDLDPMHDFIVDDEVDQHGMGLQRGRSSSSCISISSRDQDDGDDDDDDEFDEGGAVSNGRRRPVVRWGRTPSVMTITDSAATSEAGDLAEESRHLESGWSPLQEEPDSDDGARRAFITADGSDGSDSDTTVGNQISDEEDEESHQGNRSRPPLKPYQLAPPHSNNRDRGQSSESDTTENYGGTYAYDSDVEGTDVTDREGDVEMSVSPVSSRRSSTTSNSLRRVSHGSVEILGSSTAIHEVADESSDGTVLPAARRRRQSRYVRYSQTPEYDPRISMMFAQHQSDLRDATARQSPYFEPASRSRNGASYRLLPPRGSGFSTSPQPSSAVILTSVSNRPNRVQRQHPRRYFN